MTDELDRRTAACVAKLGHCGKTLELTSGMRGLPPHSTAPLCALRQHRISPEAAPAGAVILRPGPEIAILSAVLPPRGPALYARQAGIHPAFPIQQAEVCHGVADRRYGAGFRGANNRRQDPVSRLARQFLGGAVLAPEGFHPGVHDRARHHGAHQAGVRQARREDHRPLGRSGREPREMGERHQGDDRASRPTIR